MVTIYLFEPDCDGCEFGEAHEVGEEFVVSCGDASEVFELVEESLDDVALLVERGVISAFGFPVSLGRNDDLGAIFGDPIAQMVGVVSFVCDCRLCVETLDESVCKSDIVALARRADQADGVAERITGSMDFGAQPATGPAKALGIRPPFCRRAPAAC